MSRLTDAELEWAVHGGDMEPWVADAVSELIAARKVIAAHEAQDAIDALRDSAITGLHLKIASLEREVQKLREELTG